MNKLESAFDVGTIRTLQKRGEAIMNLAKNITGYGRAFYSYLERAEINDLFYKSLAYSKVSLLRGRIYYRFSLSNGNFLFATIKINRFDIPDFSLESLMDNKPLRIKKVSLSFFDAYVDCAFLRSPYKESMYAEDWDIRSYGQDSLDLVLSCKEMSYLEQRTYELKGIGPELTDIKMSKDEFKTLLTIMYRNNQEFNHPLYVKGD